MRSVLAFLPLALVGLVACPGEPASPTVTVPEGGSASMEPVEAGAAPVTQADSGPKLCGCSLCEPILSDDACKTADDCAPKTPCHARMCVAKANAEPHTSSTVCTEIFQCDAIEGNTCACISGKCAIAPRPKK